MTDKYLSSHTTPKKCKKCGQFFVCFTEGVEICRECYDE